MTMIMMIKKMMMTMYVRPLLLAMVLLAVGVARVAESRSRPVAAHGQDSDTFCQYLQKRGISSRGVCAPSINVGPLAPQPLKSSMKEDGGRRLSTRDADMHERVYNLLALPMTDESNDCYENIVDSLELEDIQDVCQHLVQMLEGENTPCQQQALAHALILHDCVPPTTPGRTCGVSMNLKQLVRRDQSLLNSQTSLPRSARIVGGTTAGSCEPVPWQARLIAFGTMCGAVILDEYHVLTAAHCTAYKDDFSRSMVTTGDYEGMVDDVHERRTPVLSVKRHEDYDRVNHEGPDIALITLREPLVFDNPCTVPVCMDPTFVPDFRFCVVSGWGKTGSERGTSRLLKMSEVRAFRGSNCDRKFSIDSSSHLTLPDSQICGGNHEGRAVFCGGDSGGPLVCLDTSTNTYVLVGIVSYNYECDAPNDPGVFTDVTAYSDWILNNM